MAPYNPRGKGPQKNPYADRRETKMQDIKKALVHKARLRRNYIKELERSGEKIPEPEPRRHDTDFPAEKKLAYQDRTKLVKERKEQSRREKEQERIEKEKIAERKREERLKKKERLSAKTSRGQPKMGPRIENLLEKIKKDFTD